MDKTVKTTASTDRVTDVVIGDASSSQSSIIFFLLCLIPALTTTLFGGVDETTWILIIVLTLAIILLWMAESWKGKGILINPSSLQLPILGLAIVGAIQLLPIPGTQSLEPYATRFFVIRLVVFFFFFAAALAFINHERRLKTAVYLIVIFGALMAFFGILQRLGNLEGIYGVRETPQAIPFGPFVNQHHFAAFMEMTGGVTLGLIFEQVKGRERKVLLATALVVMGVAVVWTSSRGGMLGFVSVLAFVTLLSMVARRKSSADVRAVGLGRQIAIAAGGVALLFTIFGVALFLGGNDLLLRGIGAVRSDVDISSGRFHFWPIAVKIFFEHPFLGAGLNAFGVAFTKHDTMTGFFRVEQAHNEYLQILADAGIAGFMCVAAFIYLLFRKGLRTIAEADGFRKSAAIGALAGCFGILVHSFFDFPLRTYSNAFFFLLLAAIATVPIASTRAKRRRSSARE